MTEETAKAILRAAQEAWDQVYGTGAYEAERLRLITVCRANEVADHVVEGGLIRWKGRTPPP